MTAVAEAPTQSIATVPQNGNAAIRTRAASAIELMAARLQVEPAKLFQALSATVFQGASNEEMLALVVVANQYQLNPFTRQIYAFPKKGGGIVPIVGIDGWIAIVNSQSTLDGIEFEYQDDGGKPLSCTCIIYVKGRSHPVKLTEYYAECKRGTDPWNQMPRRMLRHKALMQCARVAFGLAGIYDEDEGREVAAGAVVAGDVMTDTPKNGDAPARMSMRSTVKPAADMTPALESPSPAPAAPPPAPAAPATATATSSAAETLLAPSWDELAARGITCIREDDGIAVQRAADGLTLTPQGDWRDFSGWTVQPGSDEQDLLARQMAAKAITASPGPQDKPEPEAPKAPASRGLRPRSQ